ncbi:hypothetical protein L5515_017250 [Caenorhabditis briggsae]|nr:hypothetical protein L5515_017245 [Caenorhabditis briggsae]UMM40732.1 hypothetical protein L5515_017250 [Caenorhabditis briggsae]
MECKNCEKDYGEIVQILPHWTHLLGKKSRKRNAPERSNSLPQPPQFRLQIGSNQFLTVPQFDQLHDVFIDSKQRSQAPTGPQMMKREKR